MSILPKAIYRFNTISQDSTIPQFNQDFNDRSHRTRTNISKIYVEPQKSPQSNTDPEKEQIWRNHATYYQPILKSHSNQNSMVLA